MYSDTRAKLTETFDDDDDDAEEDVPVSSLRRQAASVTLDDERYAGKKIARKDLDESSDGESFSDEGEEDGEESEDQAETSQPMEDSEDDLSDDNLMERFVIQLLILRLLKLTATQNF